MPRAARTCVVCGARARAHALELFAEQSALCGADERRWRASAAFGRASKHLDGQQLGWAAYQFMDWLDLRLAERRAAGATP